MFTPDMIVGQAASPVDVDQEARASALDTLTRGMYTTSIAVFVAAFFGAAVLVRRPVDSLKAVDWLFSNGHLPADGGFARRVRTPVGGLFTLATAIVAVLLGCWVYATNVYSPRVVSRS